MVKTVLLSFLTFLGMFGLFYLVGSFYEADFNLKYWSEVTRAVVSIVGGFLSMVVGATTMINELEKKSKNGR